MGFSNSVVILGAYGLVWCIPLSLVRWSGFCTPNKSFQLFQLCSLFFSPLHHIFYQFNFPVETLFRQSHCILNCLLLLFYITLHLTAKAIQSVFSITWFIWASKQALVFKCSCLDYNWEIWGKYIVIHEDIFYNMWSVWRCTHRFKKKKKWQKKWPCKTKWLKTEN